MAKQYPVNEDPVVMDSEVLFDPPVKQHETAVILHIYYPELLDEIDHYLSNLAGDFDLYISLPNTVKLSREEVRNRYPRSVIYVCENRGRDIRPFLMIFRAIYPYHYKYICKIHTKKTTHRSDGDQWRSDLLGKLLGSPEIIAAARQMLYSDPGIGMLAPAGHKLPSRYFLGLNDEDLNDLAKMVGMDFWSRPEFDFVAGSMFWLKPSALETLLSIDIGSLDFGEETGLRDGTLAHAFERFFGFLLQDKSYRIVEIGEGNGDPVSYPYADGSWPWYAYLIQGLRGELNVREAELHAREYELSEIYRSRGWKFVESVRKILQFFRGRP